MYYECYVVYMKGFTHVYYKCTRSITLSDTDNKINPFPGRAPDIQTRLTSGYPFVMTSKTILCYERMLLEFWLKIPWHATLWMLIYSC